LTGKPSVNGSGNGARSGAQALALLSTPLNPLLLRAIAAGRKPQVELRREIGLPAQTTLRAQLKRLEAAGAIEKSRRNGFPGTLEYELAPAGRDLLQVADAIERWLGDSLPLGSEGAKAAIKALSEAWSTTMLRALATGPLSLTELDRVIGGVSYPSLERHLAALRLAGGIEATRGSGRGTSCALTDWTRAGVGPIVAAARWERRHMPRQTAPFGRIDAEAAFLLALPLLELDEALTGSCRMAMSVPGAKGRRLAGVVVKVGKGRVEACTSRLEGEADSWALGSTTAWLEGIADGDPAHLEIGGDGHLPRSLVGALHRAFFAEKTVAA
jgi:DNA-binding HxlR family transcriptional regulator